MSDYRTKVNRTLEGLLDEQSVILELHEEESKIFFQ